jgi:predicted MFS family arabinose efflux permease
MFIAVGYLREFLPLCIGTFVLSLCNESFRPANSTAIAHYSSPQNRTRSYSLNRLAINLGWAVGGALGGFLAEYNYHALFWVDGITNIVAAVMMMLLFLPVKKTKASFHIAKPVVRSPYRDSQYMFFILLVVLFAVCFLQVFGMQTLFFEQEWGVSKSSIGILMAANGLLIAFVEMVMVYYLEKKRSGLFYIRAGAVFTGIGYAMVNMIPAGFIPAFVAVITVTIGEMLVLPFMNSYWISRTTENNRGSYAALYTMAWSAAHVIAPTFGSQFAEHLGFDVLWWVVGGICAFIAAGAWRLEQRIQKENSAARGGVNPAT